MSARRVVFAPTFDGWRKRASALLAAEVPPEAIEWLPEAPGSQPGLFGQEMVAGVVDGHAGAPGRKAGAARLPRRFVDLAHRASCHRDPEVWSVLYRLAWRLARGERHLLDVVVDDDVAALLRFDKAVRRDRHKMTAFVRFRRVALDGPDGEVLYRAWYRPDHRVLRLTAPFFAERFADQRWLIATPDDSAAWDGEALRFGPGAPAPSAGDDPLEGLWRTYYRSIFNPARLKVRAMKAELPVRFWQHLPEALDIPALIHGAGRRAEAMVDQPTHPPAEEFFPARPTLPALARAVAGCRACPLWAGATQAVFGEGPRAARLVLVGEQPGDVEDRQGRPFVGPAGKLLDAALTEAGIAREEVYVTNAVKHFKFTERGKRRIHEKPGATEVRACLPWLRAELAQLSPHGVVLLGATAARALLGGEVRITRDHGKLFADGEGPWMMPTFHPAAVLRVPREAREETRRRWVADLRRAVAEVAG